jgi:hypothetical protein
MTVRVSVIVPSRGLGRPGASGELWLERALDSVWRQTVRDRIELQVVVGLDPGVTLPSRLQGIVTARAQRVSHPGAVNAAVDASDGDVLAFLEDDDVWHPRRLELGLGSLRPGAMITSNQLEVTEDGTAVRINDFATPSGWLLHRQTWQRVGPMEEGFEFHVDTEYLGRAVAAGVARVHQVERGHTRRPWLERVARYSEIVATDEPTPLVNRTVNPQSATAQIARDPAAKHQSRLEHRRMHRAFGRIPW